MHEVKQLFTISNRKLLLLQKKIKEKERSMGLTPFDLDALKLSADLLWGLGDNRWETFISIFIFAAVLRLGN